MSLPYPSLPLQSQVDLKGLRPAPSRCLSDTLSRLFVRPWGFPFPPSLHRVRPFFLVITQRYFPFKSSVLGRRPRPLVLRLWVFDPTQNRRPRLRPTTKRRERIQNTRENESPLFSVPASLSGHSNLDGPFSVSNWS